MFFFLSVNMANFLKIIIAAISFYCSGIAGAQDLFANLEPVKLDFFVKIDKTSNIAGYPFLPIGGDWLYIHSSKYNSTGLAAPVPLASFYALDIRQKNAYAVINMQANLGGGNMGDWADEPCKRDDYLYKRSIGGKFTNVNCATIGHVVDYFGSGATGVFQQLLVNVRNKGIELIPTVVRVTFTRYSNNGRRLVYEISINPEYFGIARDASTPWGSNSWHKAFIESDPKKTEFISNLKKWVDATQDRMDDAFSKKQNAFDGLQALDYYLNPTGRIGPKVVDLAAQPLPRAAAIGNVDVPVKTTVGKAVQNQPVQVTTNPLDQIKKTSGTEVWISFNPSITVQERQFCRIVENFRTENALAIQSKNQIKVNETYRNLTQSLNSLLPDGKFQGWVMRTVAVDQASDGSAEVLLELPCNIYVGSNACDANPKNFYGTAPEGSRMYTELAKMTVGDFALTSGQFVYTDDKAFDKNRSVASFRFMRTAAHCKAKQVGADTEFFGMKLDVISTIK